MRALNGSSIVGRVSLSIERKPSSSTGSSVILRSSENTLAALQKVVAECGKPKELLTSTSLSTTKGLKSHSTQGYTLCLEILPTIMANPGHDRLCKDSIEAVVKKGSLNYVAGKQR